MLFTDEYVEFQEGFLNYLKTNVLPRGFANNVALKYHIDTTFTHDQRHQLIEDFNFQLRPQDTWNAISGALASVPKAALVGAVVGITPGFVAYRNNEGAFAALYKGISGAVAGGLLFGFARFKQRQWAISQNENAMVERFEFFERILPNNYSEEFLIARETEARNRKDGHALLVSQELRARNQPAG